MTELLVSGMTCGNCARHVTEALQSVPGVRSATVNLAAGRASVQWVSDASVDTGKLVAAVGAAGYDGRPLAEDQVTARNWHLNLWVGGIVTAVLMFGEWVFGVGTEPWFQWLGFVLAGIVQVFCGAQFYRGAWRQLKLGSSNMDTLVALGSTTAFGYSVWALFTGRGGHVYFMEAAAIITLISIGHWVEARVGEKASGALKALLELAPSTARIIQSPKPKDQSLEKQPFDLRKADFSKSTTGSLQPATEMEVAVADLRPGDLVVLRPGERVPVDGVVVEGDSAVDESMLTGESAPVDKTEGKELYAGTSNVNGRLVMKVTATGEGTALANIIAAVRRAQTSRADIQRLGDRISNYFVPVVVLIALAAGLWWALAPGSALRVHEWLAPFLWHAQVPAGLEAGFVIASAVLIIACPCAMGLATPAAIMASANAGARRGILIRDGVALEKAGTITAIAFDKTGTLTEGKPKVVASQAYPSVFPTGLSEDDVKSLGASLASQSNHPLSKAVAALSAVCPAMKNFEELSGRGLSGISAAGQLIQLGSLRWLEEEKIAAAAAAVFAEQWMNEGATVLGLALNGRLAAAFALQDTLKPGADKALEKLRRDDRSGGYRIYLLTGDATRTAQAIAAKLQIPVARVFAEVRPGQKAEFIKKLQAQGERVAFVGDGINDAPALTQADLGIAVGRASDVAREAADIVLLNTDIEAVPEALDLARATLRTIKQNLFWAFFYNAVGVPLAALGFVSPVLCAAAMGFSDIIVIGNALRLARRGR